MHKCKKNCRLLPADGCFGAHRSYTTGFSLFLVLIGILLSNKCSHWLCTKGFGEYVMLRLPRIVLFMPELLKFRARDCNALRAAKYCVCQGYQQGVQPVLKLGLLSIQVSKSFLALIQITWISINLFANFYL